MKLSTLPLFWRTFLLILALIVASVLAWAQSLRVFERAPRAHQFAQQMVSVINLTRSALLYADPALRRELLAELADNEGIRIVPREPGDHAAPLPELPFIELVYERIKQRLGPDTMMSGSVNGDRGVWISFSIAGDSYWVVFERERLSRNPGTQWVSWAVAALLLSLATAVAITRVVNQPLRRLSLATRELGAGRAPAPLPERGPPEIRTVNQNFNRMVADLVKLDQDRAVLLAGISHDLRTPLTRLRLELEINDLPTGARAAMAGDIEQMDAIIRQFLDYARVTPQQPRALVDLSQLTAEAVAQSRLAEQEGVTLEAAIEPGIDLDGYVTELRRALDNLLVNARAYGRDPASGSLHLTVSLARRDREAVLTVADHGPGVPPAEIDRLLRPFERGQTARSGGTGAGLGLAIVQRVAQLHHGQLTLATNVPSGLRVELRLPLK
jgi:two-component system osmolarity sensor histidine kinase EnvZ